MSSNRPREIGAEASNEPALQNVVAGLICLSLRERDYSNSCSVETCNRIIDELISYIKEPDGKSLCAKADILGEITLLYQRKFELQAKKIQEELFELQQENSRLQQKVRERASASVDEASAAAPAQLVQEQ